MHHRDSWRIKDQLAGLIYPSSGACDYSAELPHWSYCSWFDVCWSFGVVGLEWYPCCRLQPATRIPLQPNHTETPTNVVIQQNSRKLLMIDILMSEKCWTRKKWNKITSDIKLIFYSSTPFYVDNDVCPRDSWSVILTKYYSGDQIEKNEVGGACSTYGERRGS